MARKFLTPIDLPASSPSAIQAVRMDKLQWIDVRTFGAVCNNSTDDTAAIQAAIDSIGATDNYRAGVIYIPGISIISDTILCERKGIEIVGRNWGSQSAGDPSFGSGLRWNGTVNTKPMLRLKQSIGTIVKNLRFIGHIDTAKRPTAAISIFRGTGESQPNTMNKIEHCWFGQLLGYDTAGRYLQNGISCEGVNENNDQMWFVDNVFHSCDVAINFTGTQNIINHVQECRFYENGTCIKTVAQTMITNVYFYASTDRDIDILTGTTRANGISSENSKQLARVRGSASRLIIDGEYFQYTNALSTDGRIIDAITDDRVVVDLSNFDLRNAGYTNGAVPVIAIHGQNSGATAHKVLALHDVSLNSVPLPIANLDVAPAGASDEVTIYGEQQGLADASTFGIQGRFWNIIKSGQTAVSFIRNDFINGINVGTTKDSSGSGSPEGVVTGSPGDIFRRTGGAVSEGLYLKESGVATNTGWLALTGKKGSFEPARCASTTGMTLTGLLTVDGISLAAGDRFLYKNSATDGGIYVVATGAWPRAYDMPVGSIIPNGIMIAVREGTISGGKIFQIDSLASSSAPITVGTTSLKFISPAPQITDEGATVPNRPRLNFYGDMITTYDNLSETDATDVVVDTSITPVIMSTLIDAKGDILAGTANDAIARLAVGTNNKILMADSSTSTGLKWESTGWQFAGFAKLGSAAITTGAIGILAFDELMIRVRIVSLSSSDHVALRFNGDSANNYWYRHISSVAGGQTLVNSELASTSQARLHALADTLGRTLEIIIINRLGTPKTGKIISQEITASAATIGRADIHGGFGWINTSAQITSVELKSLGGTATMAADSGMLIFGRSLS